MAKPPKDGFGWLAPWYDWLANLVFGGAIRKSQTHFLSTIPADSHILVVGGGTGWIIPEIFIAQPSCSICFVDASKGMMDRARKNYSRDGVSMVHGTVLNIPDRKFDIIILPFFLDMFSPLTIDHTISTISKHADRATVWLIADFVDNRTLWGNTLLFVMYRFFRFTSEIEAVKIPDWQFALQQYNLQVEKSQSFYGALIESKVFIRKG